MSIYRFCRFSGCSQLLSLSYNVIKVQFFLSFAERSSLWKQNHPPCARIHPEKPVEGIIRRILMTEVLEKGKNEHFRTAADFMKYFESLYPASDALTKQVQRAVQSLHMPKDADGFFIVDKTAAQVEQEQCLGKLFADANVSLHPMEQVETVFLSVPSPYAGTSAAYIRTE